MRPTHRAKESVEIGSLYYCESTLVCHPWVVLNVANSAVPLTRVFFIVNLKYILSTQIIEVPYEGEVRKFSIESVLAHPSAPSGSVNAISRDLNSLAIQVRPSLWTAGWDTVVSILEDVADNEIGFTQKVCFWHLLKNLCYDTCSTI